jgi:tetratricopeptide (TPR) repeat protein
MPNVALWIAVLVLLPIVTFGQVLSHGFVNYDDQRQLYENPDFNPPTLASVVQYWRRAHMDLYMPVTYTVWGALASVARRDTPDESGATLRAGWFHAANLASHIGSTLLVFSILRVLGLKPAPAAIGAAVFSVHPLMVEPVAWASALYTVLSGTLSLAAIRLYLEWAIRRREGQADAGKWLVLAAVVFLLAMGTKPSAVVVPVIAGVLDLLLLRRPIRQVASPVVLGLLLALPIALVVNRTQAAGFVPNVPLQARPLVAADTIAFAMGKIIAPIKLAVDYGRSPMWLMRSPQRYWTWLVPAALLAGAWLFRRRAPWGPAALLVFIAGAGPYLGLIKFDFQYHSTPADRYLYTALLGLAIAAGFIAAMLPRGGLIVAGLIVVLLAGRSFVHLPVWRDSRSLFDATLEVNPRSIVANNVIGYLDTAAGDLDSAMAHYRASLHTWPADAGANYNLANALLARGEVDEAIAHYRVAAEASPRDALVHNNLAAALARAGRYREAVVAYEQALRINPNLEMARRGRERARQLAREAATRPVTSRPA